MQGLCRRTLAVSGNRRKYEMISDEKELDHVGPVGQVEKSRCYYKVQCKAIGGFKLGSYIILVFVFKRARCLLCEE